MSKGSSDEKRVPRRGFFRLGFHRIAEAAADAIENAGRELHEVRRRTMGDVAPTPIWPEPRDPDRQEFQARPPGAVEEPRFFDLCTRCGDCLEACPVWAIRNEDDQEAHPGYPVVEPNMTACTLCEDPLPCIVACETGALLPTARTAVRLGLAVVDISTCVVSHGELCDFCVLYCPIPEQAIRMTDEGPVISESGCTGCGSCVSMCPVSAITVEPL